MASGVQYFYIVFCLKDAFSHSVGRLLLCWKPWSFSKRNDWLKLSALGYKSQTDYLWAADLQIAVLGTPLKWINKQLIAGHTQILLAHIWTLTSQVTLRVVHILCIQTWSKSTRCTSESAVDTLLQSCNQLDEIRFLWMRFDFYFF